MTKEELVTLLKFLDKGDHERNHLMADQALIEYINDPEVTEAYNRVKKWYS